MNSIAYWFPSKKSVGGKFLKSNQYKSVEGEESQSQIICHYDDRIIEKA